MEVNEIISSGLLELYVSGVTTGQENAQVEALKNQYPEIKNEIESIEKSLEAYAFAHAITPTESIKQKLNQSIFSSTQTKLEVTQAKVFSIAPAWRYVAAASIVLLIGSALLNYNYYNKLQDSVAANEQSRQELAKQNIELNQLNQNFNIIQSKYSEPIALHGLPAAPDAAAKIFWMKNNGEVYIDASNLPEAPAGKQYQLWGIVDGKPVDAGMIVKTAKGNSYQIQKMKSFGKAEAFAVTLETEGGNPTPKGDMYVMGKM